MKVKMLLEKYSRSFHTIEAGRTIGQAVKMMAGNGVSALVVTEKDTSERGIFTQQDLVRFHTLFPDKTVEDVPVRDVMTSGLVVTEPEDSIADAMRMMIKAKIRHLPVIADGRIIGLLCLEDLVDIHVGSLTRELHYLKDYITDIQDAAHD